MILYLNGSPRIKKSNSDTFLNDISANNINYLYKDSFRSVLKHINNTDTIVFSFPLYVDSPPSKVIEFMEYIKDNGINIKNKNFYIIVNCGFLESKHNKIACEIIKNFCLNNSAIYKGCFKIGAGEIIGKRENNFLFRIISLSYYFKIKKFKKSIDNKKEVDLSTSIHPMTKLLYILIVNMNFKKKINNNIHN